MTRNYQEIETPMGNTVITYEENGVMYSIPKDLANSDYQRYLRWLENPEAEQSTPIITE
jgi:hypothetical protein